MRFNGDVNQPDQIFHDGSLGIAFNLDSDL